MHPVRRLVPRWSAWGIATFILLALVLHDAHELAHTITGRAMCGAWPERNFTTWGLRDGCTTIVPTLMGPLLSFIAMWIGLVALRSTRVGARWAGLALVFAANPLARIVTALSGGGDEGIVVRAWLGWERGLPARIVTTVVVAAICLPPLVVAWRALVPAGRLKWYVMLLVTPIVVTGLFYNLALNRLLATGVLGASTLAGAPTAVTLTTIATTAIFIIAVARTRLLRPRLTGLGMDGA